MRRTLLALICCCIATATFAAEEPPYSLQVGDTLYPITPGESVDVKTPGGEVVKVRLVPKTAYNRHGITFRFPADFTLTEEMEFGIPTIVLQSRDSALAMIQVYPQSGKKQKEIHRLLRKGIEAQYIRRGAEFLEGSGAGVKAKIAGEDRVGNQILSKMAGEVVHTRIFTFPLGNKVVAVILQNNKSEAKPSALLFAPVLGTIAQSE